MINENVRMPPREMAEKLGMSKQSVHKRLGALSANGAFKSISACISWCYLGATAVLVFGNSSREPVEEVLDRLGESELTLHVLVAGGNSLYVTGLLREISELEAFVDFVRKKAEISAPTVGIFSMHAGIMPDRVDGPKKKSEYNGLTAVDLRIIESLKGDARRPVNEIADMVGVSARTVSRRLQDMISDGSLEFDIPWDLVPGTDMVTLIQVRLKNGADRIEVGKRLYSKYPFDTLWVRSFSNLPDFLLCTLSEDKMTEMHKVIKEIRADEDVLSVKPNLVYSEREYATWRNKLTSVPFSTSSGTK